jgi:signal transduction histidine kinase/ActR/RegA family two-component response regulator
MDNKDRTENSFDCLRMLPAGAGYFCFEDNSCRALHVNDRMQVQLQKSGEEIAEALAADRPDFICPDDCERIALILYKARVSGGVFHETARVFCAGGELRWMAIDLNADLQEGGTCILCLMLTDINAAKEKQKQLDDIYSRMLDLMGNGAGGIVIFNTINNRILVPSFASEGMGRLLRGTAQELKTAYLQNPYSCVHPEERETAVRTVEDAMRNLSGFQMNLRLRTLSGDYVWVSANGTVEVTENSRILYMAFLSSSDNTEYTYLLKQILNGFVRGRYDHICCIDARHNSYRVLSTNATSEEFLPESGSDFESDISAVIQKNVIPEERQALTEKFRLKEILNALSDSMDTEFFCTVSDSSGRIHYKRIWLSWIDRETRMIAYVSGDVTEEHRRAEESRDALLSALHAAEQASAAKGEFLSRMSHDIRTPLNAIIGYIEMSLESPAIGSDIRDYLSKAESSSKFLLSLINDILNMSRIESGQVILKEAVFRMPEFLDSITAVASSQCASKNIQYTCTSDGELRDSYTGDRLKLQQILLNVVGNAVKFTPEGGTVSLHVSREETCGMHYVRFAVRDTGCGISSDFLPQLFEPFSQEHRALDSEIHGTGLGLAICKSLISMMHGTIQVDSEPGKGSCFTIDIPLRSAEDKPPEQLSETCTEDICDFHGRKVLLAEDNELNMEIARHVLERVNLQVDSAENGKIACDMFAASPEGKYCAVLMDIRMPEMDGLKATRAIRAMKRRDASVPIIAMSANAFEEDIREALENGMNAYTTKPIDVQQLYRTLRRLIG